MNITWGSVDLFLRFFWWSGCKGLAQRCAATRGHGGVAAHFYTRGRIFSFLEQTVDVNEYFIDVKHCLNTVKSVDAIKNGPQYRCSWYWERIAISCSVKCMNISNAWCVKDARMVYN